MRFKMLAVAASTAAVAAVGIAAPAAASLNIPWTWNSDDRDAQARFKAEGELFQGRGYVGDTYMDWEGPSGSGRWNLGEDGKLQDFDMNWPENRVVRLNVCQQHNLQPDDCSDWRNGIS